MQTLRHESFYTFIHVFLFFIYFMLLFCCTNVRWPWRSLTAPINKCIVNRTVVYYIYYYWLIVYHNGTCLVLINFKWSLVCDHFELEPFWVGAGICSVKLLQIHLDLGLCYLENAVGLHGIHIETDEWRGRQLFTF